MVRFVSALCLMVCSIPVFAGSTQHELDIPFGDHPRQVYDLHIPDPYNGDVYLLVHGGGWSKGDKSYGDIWPDKLAHWGPNGITVAATNYRFVPGATPLEQAEDVGRALKAIQTDTRFQRIVLIGHSAGAHLALLLHVDPDLRAKLGLQNWDATIVLDTSAIDVDAIMTKGPWHGWYSVFGRDPDRWLDYSPLQKLSGSGPPILMICSTLRPAPCPQNEAFKIAAREFGQRVDVIASDKDHLPINGDIGLDQDYTSAIDLWIEQALSVQSKM